MFESFYLNWNPVLRCKCSSRSLGCPSLSRLGDTVSVPITANPLQHLKPWRGGTKALQPSATAIPGPWRIAILQGELHQVCQAGMLGLIQFQSVQNKLQQRWALGSRKRQRSRAVVVPFSIPATSH